MGKLENWDFGDYELNKGGHQINRMKSAQKVSVDEIDYNNKTGIFLYKDRPPVKTSLDYCECKDFSFSGDSPRKKFAPCMHIYRLAMELGLFCNPYPKPEAPVEKKERELLELKSLPRNNTSWGGWSPIIHESKLQIERQQRGLSIYRDNDFNSTDTESGRVSGYNTTLSSCTCMDFLDRQLPCKHIYCLAVALKLFKVTE